MNNLLNPRLEEELLPPHKRATPTSSNGTFMSFLTPSSSSSYKSKARSFTAKGRGRGLQVKNLTEL